MQYGRTYYYDPERKTGCSPFDEELGVSAQLSAGLTQWVVKLCARLPFAEATEVFEELTRVKVSTTTSWVRLQEAGQRASSALNPTPTMKQTAPTAQCIGISMDGCMANVRQEGWKEIKIGTIFEVDATQADCSGKQNAQAETVRSHDQSYVTHLGGPEGFGFKLANEAQYRHWSKGEQSVVIGDGAAWIWSLASRDYPNAAHVVDWWHAKQHSFTAAEWLYPNSADKAAQWVEAQADLLYAGQALTISERLDRSAGLAKDSTTVDALRAEAGYFFNNHQRMQYRDFRAAGLPIGSGVVESGAKQTKHRVSGPGMRWSRRGLEHILPLRAALMSGTFDPFWRQIGPF